MQSFISETLDDILITTKSFENVTFVLPSQRAGVFLKQTLKDKISTGFLPEILNIEQFIEGVSEIKKADSIELLFHFYTIYKNKEKNADSFDVFSNWAFTALQDFNEIDQHLVNSQDLFIYLRDIERLRKWSVKGAWKETALMKDHYGFLENLGTYYTTFYDFLIVNKIGYQGLMYREATKKIGSYIQKNDSKKFFFIGFNALNKAEEFLFQEMLASNKAEVYWDIDNAFYKGNHQAGKFIRNYKSNWNYYHKNEIKTIGNSFSHEKNIQLIGVSKNITQLKYAGEILSRFPNHNNSALVLLDETLLPITLNSLPKNVDAINITMGYPLKDVPTTNLIFSVFQLFETQEKLQKKDVNLFYYKDVIRFFKNPAIYKLLSKENNAISDTLSSTIVKENTTFVSQELINNFLEEVSENNQIIITSIFNQYVSISDFLNRIIELINALKEEVNELEKEYLFRFFRVFTQLQNLQNKFNYFQDLKTLQHFFKQLISSESLSFQGEPLQGLQLMGMLETRVLDFETVILTSANEGVLPVNNNQNSFIPFDVKIDFDLPTYREKDAIFSYHFFRLIQRAKNVFIMYNTEHDILGSGEKSRFITQLEMMRNDISEKVITPKVVTETAVLKTISKSDLILEKLRELAKKGFSPSTITNYLYNPIAFYKQKILKINEFENVEETVAANTMGTVVHDTLDELYKPYENKFISTEIIQMMEEKSTDLVRKYFSKHFKNGDISTGKNRLVFEVANRFVQNFLTLEKTIVKDKNNQLKIIATEQKLTTEIRVEGIPFPIKIGGIVDRIDQLNGVTRIIDYKTGMVNALQLKTSDFSSIRKLKYHKAIQVLLYAFLYTKNNKFNFENPLEAGIYSFKNLKSGFLKMNFSSSRAQENRITEDKLDEFMIEIQNIFKEIFNPEVAFTEPTDLPY